MAHLRSWVMILACLQLALHSSCTRLPSDGVEAILESGATLKSPTSDSVIQLPFHSGRFRSRHSSGYITIDARSERHLFWYLVESQNTPSTDPVVLWLNGGPGCSSFNGFIYEQGPFSFQLSSTGKLTLVDNPHAWDKAANMLYLDSPAGVGLSYSRNPADTTTNDTRTAADAERFLRLWFQAHPRFLSNAFFISGESYAGVYVPNLARAVVRGNKAGSLPHINLQGYLVGNGVTDQKYDGNALPSFAAGKSLISETLYGQLQSTCASSYSDALPGANCSTLLDQLYSELTYINIYDVLQDCYHSRVPPAAEEQQQRRRIAEVARGGRSPHRGWPVRGGVPTGSQVHNWLHITGTNPPCVDTRAADQWLNQASVRRAIHAEPIKSIGLWSICADLNYTHDEGSMIPIHRELIEQHGLRALVYSGDHDMAVPHTGSEAWTSGLNYPVLQPWQPWFVADSQVHATPPPGRGRLCPLCRWRVGERGAGLRCVVAGYAVAYTTGLTYMTIKGAGHMVPQTNPAQALEMFSRFVNNQSVFGRAGW